MMKFLPDYLYQVDDWCTGSLVQYCTLHHWTLYRLDTWWLLSTGGGIALITCHNFKCFLDPSDKYQEIVKLKTKCEQPFSHSILLLCFCEELTTKALKSFKFYQKRIRVWSWMNLPHIALPDNLHFTFGSRQIDKMR